MPAQSTSYLPAVLDHIDADLEASLERLDALLRIPSISTDPAYAAACRRAADWLADDLRAMGFAADVRGATTVPSGMPMVIAHDQDAPAGTPHVLFYGHYDVQPVDPLDLWDHPPFEPRIETRPDGSRMIRARGASDDKGQLWTFVEACRAWKAVAGALPIKVSILFEGEEESGSPSMTPFLTEHAEELSAPDLALVCDTSMWGTDTPAISTQLRGLMGSEIVLRAADRDLHSGHYGSAARNPIQLLVAILAELRAPDGSVTLPGFYDGVTEPSPGQKAAWDALGFDEAAFLAEIGLSIPAGETGRSVLEQTWSRPTCEINGIIGGYTGDGFKTVIPAEARAKVSFRLVGDQDPDAIRASFEAFVRARLPADCSVEFIDHGNGRALRLDTESLAVAAASRALTAEWNREAALIGMGGSIPIVGAFQRQLDLPSLLVGFALDGDNIHSPNEKYELKSFHKGTRSWARILAELAETA